MQPLIDTVSEIWSTEGITEYPLLGACLHQMYYHENKKIQDKTQKLMDWDNPEKVSREASSNTKSYDNPGREA